MVTEIRRSVRGKDLIGHEKVCVEKVVTEGRTYPSRTDGSVGGSEEYRSDTNV